jgi:4-amino-4-deoxy-L-arabinose transferase-like glycosyltransferase
VTVIDHPAAESPPRTSLVPPDDWLAPVRTAPDTPGVRYLLLVTALALALRLLRLGAMSLWIDEWFTWDLVAPGRGYSFLAQMLDAYQGPLYYAAVWPLVRLQDTVVMLRLPAALAGTIAVPLLGVVTARLWGRLAGRLAALLLALSPFAVWYAQEGRGYSFVILFAIASALPLLTMLRQGPDPARAGLLALFCFAGLASNFSFVFLLLAFGATVLIVAPPRRPRDWLLWSLALAGGVLLAAPWLLKAAGIWEVGRMIPGTSTGESLRGETTFNLWALPFTGFSLFYGFSLGPSLADLHGADRLAVVKAHAPLIGLGAVVAATALAAGAGRLSRRRWTILLWILVPLLGVSLLAWRNIKPFNVRYTVAALPWLLALTAAGLGRLPGRWRVWSSLALCALFAVSLGGFYLDGQYAKADLRGAVDAIAAAPEAERPILVPVVGPVVRYYWQDRTPVFGCWDEPVIRDAAMADQLVARQLAGQASAWVVWARSWDLDPRHLLPGALERAGNLERLYEGPGVAVDLWRRQDAPEASRGMSP